MDIDLNDMGAKELLEYAIQQRDSGYEATAWFAVRQAAEKLNTETTSAEVHDLEERDDKYASVGHDDDIYEQDLGTDEI